VSRRGIGKEGRENSFFYKSRIPLREICTLETSLLETILARDDARSRRARSRRCSLETYSLKTCTLETMHARDDLLNSVYLVINRMKFPFVRFPSSLVCTRNKLFLFIYIILFPSKFFISISSKKTYRIEGKKKNQTDI